jgi:ribosomal protein S18 acetylase RimI-like enzyme
MALPLIRPIVPEEVDAVAALWHEAWHDAHAGICPPEIVRHRSPGSFARRLAGFGQEALVATDAEGPVAFAALVGAEIDQFFLARRSRGSGLADRVMAALEERLAARGTAVARLECAVGNERARRFYARAGFRETGRTERPVWMPDGASAVFPMHVMEKRLSKATYP